jgi:hypothetical protein
VENPHGVSCNVASVELNGVKQPDQTITMSVVGGTYQVRVLMGK